MMVSPEWFIEELKDKKYKELLIVRDKLIESIREFETKSYDPELNLICPSPAVVYQMNLQYLGKLCELIYEKYNGEYVMGGGEDS